MSYIAAKELKLAVEELKASGCNASFIDYLLVRSADVSQGKTGAVVVSGKKLIENTNRAKFVYGTGDDDSAPYYNPLSGEFLSHRHWTNGPSDTVPRWSARENSPITTVTDSTAKSKTIRINSFDGVVVRTFFGINDNNRVPLSSISLWWYRATDLNDVKQSGVVTIGDLVRCFLRDIDLTERQAQQIFAPLANDERKRPVATSDAPADPTDYLPQSPLLRRKITSSKKLQLPRNLIFFGAPGTGKSYQLNRLAKETFDKGNVRRVTFYPDYTYSQFVGSFRPYTNGDMVSYGYIPGPFLQTYLDASLHPYENYLIIIEELNRANPAVVFGDVFQLLDRDSTGASEYAVAVPIEMSRCIDSELDRLGEEERKSIEDYFDPDLDFKDFKALMLQDLALPPNMYVWATMNSADQGVFPMDTAFKRRWDFRYMGIDAGEDEPMKGYDGMSIDDFVVTVGGRPLHWNRLRKAINKLMRDASINEDKLLGPFFLSPSSLSDEPLPDDDGQTVFSSAFKDKVLLYLYEDAGKMRHRNLFANDEDDKRSYSELCETFDEDGVAVFKGGIDWPDLTVNDGTEDADFPDGE